MKTLRALALGAASVVLAACGSTDPAQDTAHVGSDTEVLRGASAAVNEVVRAVGDCEAVKARMEDARRALDEAGEQVKTAAGQVTLDALRKRLDGFAEMCP